jgi:mRNA-degrading endonuclease RelE of RelBE toxin-antitoxin system
MAISPQVAISDSFLTALARLPKQTQKKVREFTSKFRANPTSSSINYESLHGMRDSKVRTVRIDLSYRAVVVHPPAGNLYMLVWVDNHDEAMAWAKEKVFDIHATTGAIQVVDMQFVAQAAAVVEPPPAVPRPTGLFAALSDVDLARVGLPAVLLPALRAVATEPELERLQPYLPPEAFEALFLVACGYEVDRAVRESSRPPIADPKAVDTADFTAALERPASRRNFRLVESEDELLEMLDASLDRWRIFLHPNQEAIVRTNFRGPARVLGGAGTGKTVVAMHRVRHLARLYPEGKILFTAFNRNLATNIGQLLDGLCGPERARIEVLNIHSWAVGYAGRRWGTINVVNPKQARDCWDEALAGGKAALGWIRTDYEEEWRDVIQFYGVATRDDYLKVSRAGCKKTLRRPERAQIWEGLAAFRAQLDKRHLVDWPDVVRRVRLDLESKGETPFRAVVVDEAQDIDAEQWRLLRILAPDDDNSLFITGDAHQRIYGKPITLSQFGIHIRGRSHRLKINYRTTEQVLRWATSLVAGAEIDDLDGGTDNTVGYRSLYTGPEPEVHTFDSDRQETAFLVERVRQLMTQVPAEEIAIVAKFKARVRTYADALHDAGIPHTVLDGDNNGPGVRVATMHRVKGLEFTHVVMHTPDVADASGDPRDLSLVYVAATRCRKTLTVLSPSS